MIPALLSMVNSRLNSIKIVIKGKLYIIISPTVPSFAVEGWVVFNAWFNFNFKKAVFLLQKGATVAGKWFARENKWPLILRDGPLCLLARARVDLGQNNPFKGSIYSPFYFKWVELMVLKSQNSYSWLFLINRGNSLPIQIKSRTNFRARKTKLEWCRLDLPAH